MPKKSLNIYASANDMTKLLREFEDELSFCYVYQNDPRTEGVSRFSSVESIDLFWISPAGFLGRTILLVPPSLIAIARSIPQKSGGVIYDLSPSDVECCVVLQEGGYFRQEDCLIAGRVALSDDQEWSKEVYKKLSSRIRKAFTKVGMYCVGPDAKELLLDGIRLTPQSSASAQLDLKMPD